MGQIILVGDYSQDTIEGIRNISAKASNNDFTTFQFPIGTYYQVPSTAQFYICELSVSVSVSVTKITLGYGDDIVLDSVTPPTNPVLLVYEISVSQSDQFIKNSFFIPVPYNKYLYIGSSGGTATVFIEGVEL